MPTGYTCKIQNGEITEVKDYILECARGFGVSNCIIKENGKVRIKFQEADNYYLDSLDEYKKKLDELNQLTDEEIQKIIDEKYQNKLKELDEGLEKFKKEKQRYLDMLGKVNDWQPPTNNHNRLKEFAKEQLEESLEFDCSDITKNYYLTKPNKETVKEYRNHEKSFLVESIERSALRYKQELERVDFNNNWIKNLVDSLGVEDYE